MHTISRPVGRFFVALIVWLAWVAPRAAADGAGIRPPVAPSAGGIHQLSVVGGRLSVNPAMAKGLPARWHAYFDNNLKLTQIVDTVYYANGSKAQGSLLISWPAFTTAGHNTVAAGSLAVTLGSGGAFSASLAPTTGSTPTGIYYTVVYQLGDGSNKQEYWAVPATDTTTISAVRAKLVPSTQAAQFLTRDVADSVYVHADDDQTVGGVKTFVRSPAVPDPANPTDAMNKESADAGYVHVNDTQTIGGVKTFTKSPAVPDPTNTTDAANKEYVDSIGGQANFSSPPPIGTVAPNAATFTQLTAQSANGVLNPLGFGGADVAAQINAATAANCDGKKACYVQVPAGSGTLAFAGTISFVGNMTLDCGARAGSDQAFPNLKYTGSGVALKIDGVGGAQIRNCGFDLGTSAGTLLQLAGNSQSLENVWFTGGAPGSKWVWITKSSGNAWSSDTHIMHVRGTALQGDGIFVDHSTDVSISDVNIYGYASNGINTTSRSLVIESGAGGVQVSQFGGGNSGLHGLVVADTVDPGHTPQWLFVDGLVSDCSPGGAGWLFDTSLNGTEIGATFTNSWASGAGYDCSTHSVVTANAPGILVNGGRKITIAGSLIRDNAGCGVQIDTANSAAGRLDIGDNIISANNLSNSPSGNGVCVAQPIWGLDLHDNTISNTDITGPSGNQQYAIGFATPGSYHNVRITGNDLSGNLMGPLQYPVGSYAANAAMGNTNDTAAVEGVNPGNFGVMVPGNPGAWSVPSFGAANSFLSGFSANLRFNGSNWYLQSDGTNNGGWGLFGSSNGSGSLYVVPTNGTPASDQNVGSANLPGFTSFNWDSGGNVSFQKNVTMQSASAAGMAVSGDLTTRDIPGHAYFVSKYPNIQAAINAAYGSGTVSGAVIDDRTAAYSGPGFYIPDSVTVRLAPVPYSFTSAVTHNNGNNNVTAAIIVEQGAHLAGGGTSSNHGTTITVGSGFANDIVATTSVGTGTGAGVQWWHWGSIENLNLDGSNQSAGECLHVENMGETSKVRDLLVKNCYSNNVEFVGAAATQSDIGNVSTSRSRNGSGVRFTNLSGLGKINGLSGDCNAGSLVSVQENAAGTLVITGLKSEAESTICSNGSAHDPVVLLDTMAGLNTHVHIIGGYAFGTAQNAVAKVIGSGNGIVEMEGFYSTGYTNLLNDTIRSVVVPATSMNSKQPFYYEPNGILFANQAFTLTPGTGVMGGSTSLTPIFYATTGNATMVASLGNGDGQSIMTGGVELAGQNRINYGATPEVMARAGYRFTGSAYDTTKWDLVPAWNAGDTTEKNLGNSLTVCQKGGSVSCRWSHVYGANVDALVFTLGTYTVATLPTSYAVGSLAWVGDGTGATDCTAGHGSIRVLCYYTGSAWTALTAGSAGAAWGAITGTLANQTDLQTALNGKAASNASTTVNGVPCALGASCAPGMHLVGGTMIGPQSGIVGNGADQNVFSVTIPAGTASVGTGIKCYARWTKTSASNAVTYKWMLGSTTLATQAVGASTSTNWLTELEVFTPSSLSSQVASTNAVLAGTAIQSGPQVGLTASENLGNAATLKLTFNTSNAETVTPKTFYCTTIQ